MKKENVAYLALGLSVVALGVALVQRRTLNAILNAPTSSFNGDDTLDSTGPVVVKGNSVSAVAKTKGGKSWYIPKGMNCPPGSRAMKNDDGSWTCTSMS